MPPAPSSTANVKDTVYYESPQNLTIDIQSSESMMMNETMP